MANSIRIERLVAVCTTLLILAGCSVADYKKPINDLSSAVDDSITTVEKIDQEVTEVQNIRWRKSISDGKVVLLTADNSCASGLNKCSLIIRLPDKHEKPFPTQSLMPKALVGLKGLKDYVASLKAIVDAETASAVKTSANAAMASVAEIEAEITKANDANAVKPSTIKAYSEPALAAINWLVVQYVERVKYNALAAATKRAQPVIVRLAEFHQLSGDVAATLKAAAALKAFVKAQTAYDDADIKNATVINAYVNAAETFHDVLKGRAAQPLKKFLVAHTKLNDSLNGNGDVTLADAIAAIKEFQQRAQEFKKIVDDFNKVAAAQAGE
ncbi:MAG: hypothetical protein ACC641_11205 [Acidiferrobacterales bacterium]